LYKISEQTQIIGKQIIYLTKCRSTNDIAAELNKKGTLQPGGLVLTDHQFEGRGQFGNTWESNAGENLTFSIFIQPGFLLPLKNFYLNIITSIAVVGALNEIGLKKFRIKWPNDIMFENQKLCGILIQNNIQDNKIKDSVIGLGLNINQVKFDPIIRATSLKKIFHKDFEINTILNRLVYQFEKAFLLLRSGNEKLLKEKYLSNLYWLNEMHTFRSSVTFDGKITGVDELGRLIVESNGKTKRYNFKEIAYLE
jgi:BirA family biotin operon repressor/biotin-[acetyl-CoA-carboxylase] ligase